MTDRHAEIVTRLAVLSDSDDFEAMRDLMHSEIVMFGPEGWPERGPFRGRDAVIRQFARLAEDYDERRTQAEELVGAEDRLAGRLRWHVRARQSGIESDLEVWFANRYRDGRLAEIRYFWSREEAVGAAGLSE